MSMCKVIIAGQERFSCINIDFPVVCVNTLFNTSLVYDLPQANNLCYRTEVENSIIQVYNFVFFVLVSVLFIKLFLFQVDFFLIWFSE